MIDGKTRVLGLIGDPVEHTLSPVIHNGLTGENCVYLPFHVKREGLEAAIRGAYELGIQGLNVTVPHKSAVIPLLSFTDPMAKAIGAVNTLVRVEDGYAGYNTDAEGFGRELDYYGIEPKGELCVMLGAGGASRAVAFTLAQKGAGRIMIFNRDPGKAETVAGAVNGFFGRQVCEAHTYAELELLRGREYLAVQCTSVGLYPDTESCVVEDEFFYEGVKAGVDLIYRPAQTKFMKLIREKGGRAFNGLRMLLYQGIAAYERFMDVKVAENDIEAASMRLKEASGIRRSVILTGYMGSGKSTVAALLGDMMGCPVIDSDAAIEKEQGRSISRIFKEEGEEAFRDMETAFLKKLQRSDETFVLSTGGGMVMREENRRIMKEGLYADVVYLKAEPGTLIERLAGDDKRPLLAGAELETRVRSMLSQRGPVYEETADLTVSTDSLSPQEVAASVADPDRHAPLNQKAL